MSEAVYIRPINYVLNIDDERHKRLRPYFKLSSGPHTRRTQRIEPTESLSLGVLKLEKFVEEPIIVELWDRNEFNRENLLGRGHLDMKKLEGRTGICEEWVVLLDRYGRHIGKALMEVELPRESHRLTKEDLYRGVVEDAKTKYGGFLEDSDLLFNRMFEDTNKMLENFLRPEIREAEEDRSLRSREVGKTTMPQEKPEKIKATKETTMQKEPKKGHVVARKTQDQFDSLLGGQASLLNQMMEDTKKIFDEFAKDILENEEEIPSLFPSEGEKEITRIPEVEIREEPIRLQEEIPRTETSQVEPLRVIQGLQGPIIIIEEREPMVEEKERATQIRPEDEQLSWSHYEQDLRKKFENLQQQQQKMFDSLLENSKSKLEGVSREEVRAGDKERLKEEGSNAGKVYDDVRSGFDRMLDKILEDSQQMFNEIWTGKLPAVEKEKQTSHV